MTELKKLLEGVGDSYSDFVIGTIATCENHGITEEMKRFITDFPDADSSNIIEYRWALIYAKEKEPDLLPELIDFN